MIEWFTWAQIAVAVVAGLLAVALGLFGRTPDDLTMGATALVTVLLVVQVVVSLLAPAFGNTATGSALEFWVYLVTALIIPPLAIVWGLVDRTRWSTAILGVACLAVAVMLYRMYQIWFVQVA
ncbi:lysylphosphatidylglycerol synthetase-like protein (DUF2156 family) [Conyzicola nivalis]|uniref:Lysylphosphatidylglycerol synthetase-like protein (DUF2156 family) n=1 Tax=Conyzicola nivalis TaxID=1477021 RepID=A0ABV2QJT5_9MICO